jgi:nucleoside-diphosphate-sugar epimerase
MARVFVAGATGVIGRLLVPLLLGGGHEVVAMTRGDGSGLRSLGARPVSADAFDREAVHAAVAEARPDALVHQLTDLRGGSTATNAALRREGTRNLVDAARAAGVRRIVAQSIAWAYAPGEHPAREDEPLDLSAEEPRRTTVLGVDALETAVRELPEWVVLRYGLLYGPATFYAPDGAQADAARAGTLVAGADVSSFVHAEDAARAAAFALEWPPGAVNVCDDDPAPASEWVPAFCAAVGAPAPPAGSAPRTPWARGADNARSRELGWAPARDWRRDGW